MPAPRNPITVGLENTFNYWRQETNAVIDIINYFLNSNTGYVEMDSPTLTNVNVNGGTVQNVTIQDATLEPTTSGVMNLNSVGIADSTINTSTFNNGEISESTLHNVTASGFFNVHTATLNISNGTESDRINKGVGGTAELFWDRTNQELRVFDGTTVGGKLPLQGTLDADTLDGQHYADIQQWVQSWVDSSADVPNADFADVAGDADTLDGQHYTDIQTWTQNWVTASGDVPNADFADLAGDADTLDGQHYTDIQNWVNASADVPNADYADVAGRVRTTEPTTLQDGDMWIAD